MHDTAKLIVLNGPIAGQSFALGEKEVTIGRSPTSSVILDDPGVDWKHGAIRNEQGAHVLLDFGSGKGTFVNGIRLSWHRLEDADQIGMGETVIVYHLSDRHAAIGDARSTLVRASAFLYLVRALAGSQGHPHYKDVEKQLLCLVADLVPGAAAKGGAVLLGDGEEGLRTQAMERDTRLAALIPRACAEGPVLDAEKRLLVQPFHAMNKVAGILAVHCSGTEDHFDLLSAVATFISFALESAREAEMLRTEKARLEDELGASAEIVGNSHVIGRLCQMIDRIAPSDAAVLILGESGTGKEVVARALHRGSLRHKQPFVGINCAAINAGLLESELFGHEKGAFTGAVTEKKGRFEVAQGGTLFLDEIGEMDLELQAKLLRVLQEHEMVRVGGNLTIRLDVRIVAATNRDLEAAVRQRIFREDLFHRLNVIVLRTPALREHRVDIPLLAWRFLARAAARCGRRITGITPDAERLLMQYDWPGNIRELENAIEHAVVLGDSDQVRPEDLPESVIEAAPAALRGRYQQSVSGAKRGCILNAYQQSGGDYKTAARLLGIHPVYLLRLVRKLNLKDEIRNLASASHS